MACKNDSSFFYGVTDNAVLPPNKSLTYMPRTLLDQTLEFIDPNPSVNDLLRQFDKKFFNNTLTNKSNRFGTVEFQWDYSMTISTGQTNYDPISRKSVISLSLPLLQLRPRKDLVQTLLHEMIHAYLFLTGIKDDSPDGSGHGTEFQRHMHRINQEAGTKITIHHNFVDEVRLYQVHWWRCTGPCQKKAPYFGMLYRRTVPGEYDRNWAQHQRTCGGTFINIGKHELNTEPISINPEKEKKLNWIDNSGIENISFPKIFDAIPKTVNYNPTSRSSAFKPSTSSGAIPKVRTKSSVSPKNKTSSSSTPKTQIIVSPGTKLTFGYNRPATICIEPTSGNDFNIEVSSSARILEVTKADPNKVFYKSNSKMSKSTAKSTNCIPEKVTCPKCEILIPEETVNEHLDSCLLEEVDEMKFKCPSCDVYFRNNKDLNEHIDDFHIDRISDDSLCPTSEFPCSNNEDVNIYLDPCVLEESLNNSSGLEIIHENSPVSTIISRDSSSVGELSDLSRYGNFECPACGSLFLNYKELDIHLDDECKGMLGDPEVADVSSCFHSTVFVRNQTCLICCNIIDESVTFDEHLDACIGDIFEDVTVIKDEADIAVIKDEADVTVINNKDDEGVIINENNITVISNYNDVTNVSEESSKRNANFKNEYKRIFTCPICLGLSNEFDMNLHLDYHFAK